MEKKKTEQRNEPHDPKLPIIHGQEIGNRAQQHVCQSPIEQMKIE